MIGNETGDNPNQNPKERENQMTGINSMFKQPIVQVVCKLLQERCKDGGVCKRDEIHSLLAEKFGLPGGEYQDAIVKAAVEGGVFNQGETQYANFKGGRGGCAAGVREVDVPALRHAEEVAEKRRANMAKAREVRMAKLSASDTHAAEVKAKRQANIAKAREARMAKLAAATVTPATA
jgi:hypothetical protein